MTGPAAAPLIGLGQVRHARLRPARNSFAYGTYFLMLPMRGLRAQPSATLARNRFGLIVLAIPGGVHDNRVRLNERFNLPYTPDMAGVYLEAL